MHFIGTEHMSALVEGRAYDLKMVFNDRGAIVFPSRLQHRDMKAPGISYEDNYVGNALAAMVRRDEVEVRFHKAYDDKSVARILSTLLAAPELAPLAHARVTYQGRVLAI